MQDVVGSNRSKGSPVFSAALGVYMHVPCIILHIRGVSGKGPKKSGENTTGVHDSLQTGHRA